jgi:hypothetical protein
MANRVLIVSKFVGMVSNMNNNVMMEIIEMAMAAIAIVNNRKTGTAVEDHPISQANVSRPSQIELF